MSLYFIVIGEQSDMFVTTRKIGEALLVGSGWATRILVLGTQRGRVRLGIEAPPEVALLREELLPLSKQRESK